MKSKTVEAMIEVDGAHYDAQFERTWSEEVDPNYGADADGRRGERKRFIDDDTASEVWVTVPLGFLDNYWQKQFKQAVHKWMNEHNPGGEI